MANPTQFYDLIKELFLILDDGDRQLFGHFALTATRYYALLHIDDEPGISLSRLSDKLLCDKSNITRIIKSMETDGLVSRQPNEQDGRALRLYLTDNGRDLLARVSQAHLAYNHFRFTNSVATEDTTQLVHRLNHLKHQLNDKKPFPTQTLAEYSLSSGS